MTFKKKKASIIISLIDLVLAIGIFIVYIGFRFYDEFPSSSLFSNEFYSFLANNSFNFDLSDTYSYFIILSFYLPCIFAFIGLFGKLLRIFNILPLAGFISAFIGYIAYQSLYATSQEFLNFSSNSCICFSCIFFISVIGIVLSTINLIKSK